MHRVRSVVGFVLIAAVIVLSVIVSPYIFAGFMLVCAAFGVLRWGWRVARGTQP